MPTNGTPKRTMDPIGTLALFAEMLCMISVPVIIRGLTVHLDSFTQNLFRYVAALAFWLPFLIIRIAKRQVPGTLWKKALIPLIPNLAQQTLYAAAFYYIEPAFMSLLLKSSVVWILLFSVILFKDERALMRSVRFWIGLILAVGGIVGTLLFRADFSTEATLIGILIALLSALTWGIYTISVRIAFKETDSRLGFSVMAAYTFVGILILAFVFGEPSAVRSLTTTSWIAVASSGIFGIALGHTLYYVAVKRLGASITSLTSLASPFLVLAISFVAFGETLTVGQWLSGIVLVVGAGIALWSQRDLGARKKET